MSSSFYSQIGIPSANSTAIESNVATSQTAATNSAASATNSASSASASAASATAANAADVSATQSKNAAETAETNSAASAALSATSSAAAVTAKTASETAKTASELAATNASTSETNAAASATSAASSLAAIGTSVNASAASATAAASTLATFQNQYLGAASTAPTADPDGSALDLGDLWFDSASDTLKVYASGGWVNAGSSVNGTSERQTYTATAGQTTFAVTYDAGFVDCYMNGAKLLVGSDFTATSGTNIVLASGAAAGDIVDIIAFGTFALSTHYNKTQSDARYIQSGGSGSYANSDVDTHLNQSTATTGQYLKWNGSDYAWDTVAAGYADSDVNTHLNQSSATTGQYLKWNGSDYAWDTVAAGYADSDVNTHLNQSSATTGQYLKWNGSDYAWDVVPAGVGGATGVDFNDSVKARFGTGNDLEIYSGGTGAKLHANNGILEIEGDSVQIWNGAASEAQAKFTANAGVELYYDGNKKIETTSGGAKVSGSLAIEAVGQLDDNGTRLLLRSSGDASGLRFDGAGYTPFKNGSVADNTVDLGYSAGRYKSLYLGTLLKIKGTNPSLRIEGDSASYYPTIHMTGLNGGLGFGAYYGGNISGNVLNFRVNSNSPDSGTHAAQFDSYGHFMTTKTSLNTDTVGVELRQNGLLASTRDGGQPLFLNRLSNDGTIVSFAQTGSTKGSITISGSSTAYNTSSDYRLKENVTDVTDGITRVKQLSPKRFNFIVDADTTVDGFLAHEAATVVPEAVTGTKDAMMDEEYTVTAAKGNIVTPPTGETGEVIHSSNVEQPDTLADGQAWRKTSDAVMGTRSVPDMQQIDQAKLVPLLTAALQEAIAKIETLETRLTALEAN